MQQAALHVPAAIYGTFLVLGLLSWLVAEATARRRKLRRAGPRRRARR